MRQTAVSATEQANEMTTTTDYLRPAQIGEIMGWSLNTLANYRSRGEGPPYVKVRNRVLYPLSELDRWIVEQAKKSENKKASTQHAES